MINVCFYRFVPVENMSEVGYIVTVGWGRTRRCPTMQPWRPAVKTLVAFVLLVAAGLVAAVAQPLDGDVPTSAQLPAVLPPGEFVEGALPPVYIVERVRSTGRRPLTNPA